MANGQYEAVLEAPPGLPAEKMVAEVGDGELLAQFAAHRDELAESAFEVLVRRHGPMVLRVCQQVVGDRHIAEDAFQATFLILSRKAGSIRQPELLGHWLHGVALRTSREARMRDDRRRRRESARAGAIEGEPIDGSARPDVVLVCREAFEALHEEVSRLPDRYRAPVILCDLEGMTYQQAAYRLRCPVGTIGVRLRRARERLRAGLTRRGLAPTAGLLGALVVADAASARVPTLLVDSTVQAAMGFAAGEVAATGLVSTSVSALTEAGLRAMSLARLKLAMGVALAVGIAGMLGWLGARGETRVLVVTGQASPRPADEATGSRDPDATGPDETRHGGQAPVPSKLDAPEPRTPRPNDELPTFDDPALRALAARAIRGLEDGFQVARRMADGLLAASREREREQEQEVVAELQPQQDDTERGALLFAKEWASDDPMSHGGDGLGPIYNESSCVACHGLGAPGGAGPESKNVVLVTSVANGCGPPSGLDSIFPSLGEARTAVLHRYSTDPEYAAWRNRFFQSDEKPKGKAKLAPKTPEETVAGRIRAVKEQTSPDRRQDVRSLRPQSMNGVTIDLAERNTPPLFGTGRIDEIPYDVLIDVAAHQPGDVRGRVARTRDGRIGRFGWKAQVPSLHEFVRVACANELGLEVPGHSQPASPLAPARKASGLDLTESDCDALVSYVRALPAPVVVDPVRPTGHPRHAGGPPALHRGGLCVLPHPESGPGRRDLQRPAAPRHGPEPERFRQQLRDRRTRHAAGAESSRVAHAAAVGLPRFRPLPARRPRGEPGGSHRPP